jgi:biopolymer transport protein ExbD
VSIDASSRVFIDKREVSLESLAPELKQLIAHDPDLALSLQADEGVPYRAVAKVLATIQLSGVSKLSVLTQPAG